MTTATPVDIIAIPPTKEQPAPLGIQFVKGPQPPFRESHHRMAFVEAGERYETVDEFLEYCRLCGDTDARKPGHFQLSLISRPEDGEEYNRFEDELESAPACLCHRCVANIVALWNAVGSPGSALAESQQRAIERSREEN